MGGYSAGRLPADEAEVFAASGVVLTAGKVSRAGWDRSGHGVREKNSSRRPGRGTLGPGMESQNPPNSSPPPSVGSERRGKVRHLACFPAHVSPLDGGEPRTALIRDLSVTGAQLYTQAALDVGAQVTLSLYITEDLANPVSATGVVVRASAREDDEAFLWSHVAGVHFDQPLTQHEDAVRALAARQGRPSLMP
jgi:hypothetical protein